MRPALPRIAILGTGGTIAGAAEHAALTSVYRAGVVGVDVLAHAVPALSGVACIQTEQIANIDSKDIIPGIWIALAKRAQSLLQSSQIDGIVIAHGTDTLEETGYLLHLALKTVKPVVLTGAMRPSTALSADGPLNLLNAVTVAASPKARSQGVLAVFNSQIHSARDVAKSRPYSIDGFGSPGAGAIGRVQDGEVEFDRSVLRPHTQNSQFSIGDTLPRVEVVVGYAGASRVAVDAFVSSGVQGLVIAGCGSGALPSMLEQAAADAVRRGVAVVRASRAGAGNVMRNGSAPDDLLGTISAGTLGPFKARVLLMLVLAAGVNDSREQQRIFDKY